jgi:trk system potassium uptake protein TrkH
MTLRNRILKPHAAILVLASFLLAITVGTLLLMLPMSTRIRTIPFVDALFTATSAVCATGNLLVVSNEGWSSAERILFGERLPDHAKESERRAGIPVRVIR